MRLAEIYCKSVCVCVFYISEIILEFNSRIFIIISII